MINVAKLPCQPTHFLCSIWVTAEGNISLTGVHNNLACLPLDNLEEKSKVLLWAVEDKESSALACGITQRP